MKAPVGAALLAMGLCFSSARAADPAGTAVNALGVDLLTRATEPGQNAALSPFSIQAALAMTWLGAEGETRTQMSRVLHYGNADTALAIAALQKDLLAAAARTEKQRPNENGQTSDPITLHIANRLFGQKGYPFRPAFLDLLKMQFAAPLEELDFEKNPAAAARHINAWVEKQTRDRIKDLVPEDALSEETGLVLVNALYFKAPWADPFETAGTKPGAFHLAGGGTADVPFLGREDTMGYRKFSGFAAAALPYLGGELQFLILLPDKADGLPALEKRLDAALLAECAKLPDAEVNLRLPKFRLEPPRFALGSVLQKLGMPSAFDRPQGSANFDGIAPRRPNDYLYISDVFHKTFLAIDEQGTEAAAATAVVMMRALAMMDKPKPVVFHADRPFLFAIQDRASGACLFLGRLVDPR